MRIPVFTSIVSPQLRESVTDMRARISQVSEEAVTGRRSDLTAHLNGRVGKAMLSEKAVADIRLEREQINLRLSRLNLMSETLGFIQAAGSNLATEMQTALGTDDRASQENIGREAMAALNQIFTALNTRHGERYIFAGDATDTRPFATAETLITDIRAIADASGTAADFDTAIEAYFNDPAGPWQTSVYSGTPSVSDPDAVTGIDPAITDWVAGIAVLALASPESGSGFAASTPQSLESAASGLLAAEADLINLRAERGIVQEQLGTRLEALVAEETFLSQVFNELTARDQYEAASELRELETNLEAAYLLTTRLSSLSLLNFLR